MQASSLLAGSGTYRAIGAHLAGALACAAIAIALALTPRDAQRDLVVQATTIAAVLAVVLLVSTGAMIRMLRVPAQMERFLAAVGTGKCEPFVLPNSAASSPAAVGWNRLVALARTWQTMHELEQSAQALLSQRGATDIDQFINALADGVVATGLDGRISLANMTFAAMCGCDDGQALAGRTLAEALPAGNWDVQQAGKSPQARLLFDLELPGDGGASRLLRCARRPRPAARGELAGHVWTVRDVTQQRLAEAMREKFLAAATHELRTPLANIRGYAESLAIGGDIDVDSQKRFYNIIQDEAVRLARLIDDLLDISRMQAGALSIERHQTDIARLVEEVSAKVHKQMLEKRIQFRCELPPKLPKSAVDKSKLAAALVNLLGNAAKYTPAEGRVTFRVESSDRRLEFAVTDTGIGISPEELPRVFDRFFRSDDDRVREIPGSGLGLSLTQEVARLHGGEVTVESVLNKGSVFRLTIPLDSAER